MLLLNPFGVFKTWRVPDSVFSFLLTRIRNSRLCLYRNTFIDPTTVMEEKRGLWKITQFKDSGLERRLSRYFDKNTVGLVSFCILVLHLTQKHWTRQWKHEKANNNQLREGRRHEETRVDLRKLLQNGLTNHRNTRILHSQHFFSMLNNAEFFAIQHVKNKHHVQFYVLHKTMITTTVEIQ